MASGHEPYIWGYFKKRLGGNEYGVAGLMGNLQAESGMHPDRVQDDIPYSEYSRTYTKKVDNGVISRYKFINNGPGGGGYGLAQWTSSGRKTRLYDTWKNGGYKSIGGIDLACDYLWWELQHEYPRTLSTLLTATSVRKASDMVLHDFERPADQSTEAEERRAALGQAWYNMFTGTSGGGDLTTANQNYLIIESAIAYAVGIAEDNSHGYDQGERWGPDYDCSSLLITAFEQAGCPVYTNGARRTHNMIPTFTATGFYALPYTKNLELIRGDVLWREGHTAMYIGDGDIVSAHANELGGAMGGQTGDQTGHEIDVSSFASSGQWTTVLRLPSMAWNPNKGLKKILLYAIATDRF